MLLWPSQTSAQRTLEDQYIRSILGGGTWLMDIVNLIRVINAMVVFSLGSRERSWESQSYPNIAYSETTFD